LPDGHNEVRIPTEITGSGPGVLRHHPRGRTQRASALKRAGPMTRAEPITQEAL
jgi:hypothetical protein